ncbi:MAG TPA: FGGY-family carbohydrate kinase [Anseongella sp.]|nr:FGGY-family carbohydrate kinase [Anseongella sp.]
MDKAPVYFLGIDIGTQGARAILVDEKGNIPGGAEEGFPLNAASREEQSPEGWWDACFRALQRLFQEVKGSIDLSAVKALAVTSTSGTVIPLDGMHTPLHKALMYSDTRSGKEAETCKRIALRFHPEGFTSFNSSSGLSKMLWFQEAFPEKAARLAAWAHAADYITGRISNTWGVSDFTNALKSGYDVKKEEWPSYIYEQLPLKKEWLPRVVPSGIPVGLINPSLARSLGLSRNLLVVAGMTDGCASQIASGAMGLGAWNTTIGTTLVIKGVTRQELKDPEGRFYSHRHPEGYWMPGGASNTGADWVREYSERQDLQSLDEQAGNLIPGGHIAYPLLQQGERFPFIAPQARGFGPEGLSLPAGFLARMEGVAYVERYAFDLAEALSGEKVNAVYSAGGGSNSATWLSVRSNVLNKPVYLMKEVSGAAGAAILAASKTHFTSLSQAARSMTRVRKTVRPVPALAQSYEKFYRRFLEVMQEKGYIHEEKKHA